MKKFLIPFILIFAIVFWSCNENNSNPSDDNSAFVLESKSFSIDSKGGTFKLNDSSGVIIPEDALNKSATLKIKKVKPEKYELGSDNVIIEFECDVEFQKEVEIFISSNIQKKEISGVGGLYNKEAFQIEISSNQIVNKNGIYGLSIKTNHFSPYGGNFWEWPPDEAGPYNVTYYNQGETPYCWANCLQMLCESVKPDEDLEVYDWIRELQVGYEGLSQFLVRGNSTLKSMIKHRTGVFPERKAWIKGGAYGMDTYLKHCLALGYPVMIGDPVKEHAYVVVGYSGNTFYIHDPQSVNDDNICYETRTWEKFEVDKIPVLGFFTTFVLQMPVVGKKLQTINISNNLIKFTKLKTANSAGMYVYFRYANNGIGYGYFENLGSSFPGINHDTIPDGVTTMEIISDLANSDPKNTKNMKISFDIWGDNNKKIHKSFLPENIIKLPPRKLDKFKYTIPISEFRDSTFPASTSYTMLISLIDNDLGIITDQITVKFIIEAPYPNLNFNKLSIGGQLIYRLQKSGGDYIDFPEMDMNYYKIPLTFVLLKGTFLYYKSGTTTELSGTIDLDKKLDKMTVNVNFYEYKGQSNEVLESFTLKNIPIILYVNGSTTSISANPKDLDPLPYLSSVSGYAKAYKDYNITQILSWTGCYITLNN